MAGKVQSARSAPHLRAAWEVLNYERRLGSCGARRLRTGTIACAVIKFLYGAVGRELPVGIHVIATLGRCGRKRSRMKAFVDSPRACEPGETFIFGMRHFLLQ